MHRSPDASPALCSQATPCRIPSPTYLVLPPGRRAKPTSSTGNMSIYCPYSQHRLMKSHDGTILIQQHPLREARSSAVRQPYVSSHSKGAVPQAIETSSPSDKVHVLGARGVEVFPPNGNVKLGTAAATIVRVSQTVIEVETGTRADDLIFCN